MKSAEAAEAREDEVMLQADEVRAGVGAGAGGGAGGGGAAGGGERQVQIHPLVVVNVADHHTRQKCGARPAEGAEPPRAIGALFGVQSGLDVAVFDSFEIKCDVVDGAVQIDREFLTSRTQQCAYLRACVLNCRGGSAQRATQADGAARRRRTGVPRIRVPRVVHGGSHSQPRGRRDPPRGA